MSAKVFFLLIAFTGLTFLTNAQTYKIVDTGQETFYDSTIYVPSISSSQPFYGQDAHYSGNQPSYTDNGDGTITDNVTGLMWTKSPDLDYDGDIDYYDKVSFDEAPLYADTMTVGGYTDWRVPTIKEQYSLIMFYGVDPSGYMGTSTSGLTPFIDTMYFDFGYGDQNAGERIIDAQFVTTTLYKGTTMGGNTTMFGTNFADGRIKGYPITPMMGDTVPKQFYAYFVRGGNNYGTNNFVDNGDGTVTDNATGLMWTKDDNGSGVLWETALSYAEASTTAGYNDWRLPNVKELQSIVDYSRSPDSTASAALSSVFNITSITNEAGQIDYPCFWSGTTHIAYMMGQEGANGAYVSFGRGMGYFMNVWQDVHGAGCQRSDPKVGDPADYPTGFGPQGDAIRIYNYVRLVRDADNVGIEEGNIPSIRIFPNPATENLNIVSDGFNNGDEIALSVFNSLGAVVLSQNIDAGNVISLDLSSLHAGIYFIILQSSTQTARTNFIKQ
ncbi:MAG: hypothetical protein C0592_06295 [Marinilabiliales bacterium]|nr:MAG: hypothetical protein C0592_06295 [Marinilabiliales bacterium]